MRTVLLSNINMDPLKPFLKGWDVETTSYNDVLFQLLDPKSRASAKETELILCHIDGDQLLGGQLYGEGTGAQKSYLDALESFCLRASDTLILTNTIVLDPSFVANYADVLSPESLRATEATVNGKLIETSRQHANLVVLDLGAIYRRFGVEQLDNANYWYAGRIKYSNTMFRVLARHYGQLLDGVLSRTKKLLVVDLDNTLWGGVIGEEGIDGIQLGEDGVGKCYRDFQRAIAGLKRQGVLLAINSKNNLQDVQDAFERHPMMVLALDDFICKRINWSNKATNMAEIAAELNLGLDSFVFIDDNAVERQLVKENLPEVNVPDFPERPVQLRRWFVDSVVYSHFPRYRLTAEDQRKTEQYQANVGRQKLQESLDLQGFVEGLGITVRFYTDTLEHVDRATQLTQKTNQFNTTTRRYSPAQMRSFMESSSKGVVLLEYEDKFGKEGIVGLSLLDLDKGEVDSFLLSCRIIGRGVESRFLDEIERQMRETGHRAVTARFISTAKNQPASTLFEDHGYELCKKESNGTKLFKKELD